MESGLRRAVRRVNGVLDERRAVAPFEGEFVGRLENHARSHPRLVRLLPPRRAETPAVAGMKAGEAHGGLGGAEIVSGGKRKREELLIHDGAHRVDAHVPGARRAAPVAKEAREGVVRAVDKFAAEHVPWHGDSLPSVAHRHGAAGGPVTHRGALIWTTDLGRRMRLRRARWRAPDNERAGTVSDASPFDGEYEPPTQGWVRKQVETYEATGGAEGNTLMDTGLPVIIVTTVGAKSGKVRKVPLMRVKDGDSYALVASKGGTPENPSWYYNLSALTRVRIQDGPTPSEYDVREVDGSERQEWWDRAVAAFPPYEEYQEKTDRTIPVFVATPRN